ncbi:helix-turn-helix transcriptional regulator [Haliea sp. E17]|uniref:helix-turn-helix transcriptional regulator n=1 Tax=Haliea sp. E17 TaxID=3401576 RepID=UPI003AAD0BDF
MTPDQKIIEIVDSLYLGVSTHEGDSDFIKKMNGAFGFSLGAKQIVNLVDGTSQFSDAYAKEYENNKNDLRSLVSFYNSELSSINPLPTISFEKSLVHDGAIMYSESFMPIKDWVATQYFDEFFVPHGWLDHLAVIAQVGPQSLTSFSFTRDKNRGLLPDNEKYLLSILSRHIVQAYRIRSKLQGLRLDRDAAWLALDAQAYGVAIIDSSCKVVFLNSAGTKIVNSSIGILIRKGQLDCTENNLSRKLKHQVSSAVAAGIAKTSLHIPNAIRVPSSAGKKSLTVFAYPLRMDCNTQVVGRPACLVFLCDPSKELGVSIRVLNKLFGLTDTEARVAINIARGMSLEQSAIHLSHSLATSRTVVKRVFSKTDTSRQSELACLILSLNFDHEYR